MRRVVSGLAAGLQRRRAARAPRVTVRERGGQPRTLAPEDPRAQALRGAAERVLSAAQRALSA